MTHSRFYELVHGPGAWATYGSPGDTYIAVAVYLEYPHEYVLSFHKGRNPMFEEQSFDTFEELVEAAKSINPHQDLNNWYERGVGA